MEIYIDIWVETESGNKSKTNEAIYTLAVDDTGRPLKYRKSYETELEIQRYEAA
jgi:hypothetical protein